MDSSQELPEDITVRSKLQSPQSSEPEKRPSRNDRMEALFEHIKNELGGLRTDMTRLDERMASLEENNASLRQVIADSTRSEDDLSRRTTVLPRSPEYSAKFTPGSVLAANRQRASTLTAEQMDADS
jgi:hypothetical protein